LGTSRFTKAIWDCGSKKVSIPLWDDWALQVHVEVGHGDRNDGFQSHSGTIGHFKGLAGGPPPGGRRGFNPTLGRLGTSSWFSDIETVADMYVSIPLWDDWALQALPGFPPGAAGIGFNPTLGRLGTSRSARRREDARWV